MVLIGCIGAAEDAAETGPGTTSSGQITQTISLEPGWNSVSFKVPDLSFDQDIKAQCSFNWYNQQLADGISSEEIENDERYYVWAQRGGEWSHPDELEVSEGYSFNVGSECEIEVSGERERVDSFELEDGWNLANVPSGLALGQIKEECNLRWYNQDLSNVDTADEISQSDRYYFWVNDGNSWRNPLKQDDHRGDDGVYINSDGACQISSWPYDGEENDYQKGEDDETQTDLGRVYFEENDNVLVSNRENSEYEMYDNQIQGRFFSEIEGWNDGERKLIVKNMDTGVKRTFSDHAEVISVPPEEDIVFNLEESGFGKLENDGTTFNVRLEHENEKSEHSFTFYPSDSIADWQGEKQSLNEGEYGDEELGQKFEASALCKSDYYVKYTESGTLAISKESKNKMIGNPIEEQEYRLDNFKVSINEKDIYDGFIEFTPECK